MIPFITGTTYDSMTFTRTKFIHSMLHFQGEFLHLWNERANVLIWGLQFGLSEIIWSLKFRGPKCAICDLKFGVGELI